MSLCSSMMDEVDSREYWRDMISANASGMTLSTDNRGAMSTSDESSGARQRGLFLVFLDPRSDDHVEELDRWFDETHMNEVLGVIGFRAGARFRRLDMAGCPSPVEQRYVSVFEIEAESIDAVAAAMTEASKTMAQTELVRRDPAPVKMWFREVLPWRSAPR
jgi:hypothetical protein